MVLGAMGSAVGLGATWCDGVRHAAFGVIGVLGCLATHAVVVDHGRVRRPVCTGRVSGSLSGSAGTGVWTRRCRGGRWPCGTGCRGTRWRRLWRLRCRRSGRSRRRGALRGHRRPHHLPLHAHPDRHRLLPLPGHRSRPSGHNHTAIPALLRPCRPERLRKGAEGNSGPMKERRQ